FGPLRGDLCLESADTTGRFISQRHARLTVTFSVVYRISVGRGCECARLWPAGFPARRGDAGRLRLILPRVQETVFMSKFFASVLSVLFAAALFAAPQQEAPKPAAPAASATQKVPEGGAPSW